MPSNPDIVELLQTLIRFDTTNPPGSEAACIHYLHKLLLTAGLETAVVGKSADRPNLFARLAGAGAAPPLLLYGHVDVVTTAGQKWEHPPFSGEIVDGMLWGRGTLDMKGGLAMLISAILRLAAEGYTPPGDLLFLALSDEEQGSAFGAQYITSMYRDWFRGVRYALGEFGGFPLYVGEQRFYAIGVAEKQPAPFRMIVRGQGGHGARPLQGSAPGIAGRILARLDETRTPTHITPFVTTIINTTAAALPRRDGALLRALLDPDTSDMALDMLGADGRLFAALLRNTASATILRGGEAINVIPSEVEIHCDGRLLPGYSAQDLFRELQAIIGSDLAKHIEFASLHDEDADNVQPEPDLTLFDLLADILRKADPTGIPIPYMLSGVTDARYFNNLGIQTYGFLPMNLPKAMNFATLLHAANERLPIEALHFGAHAVYEAVKLIGQRLTDGIHSA